MTNEADRDALHLRTFAFIFALASLFHHAILSTWANVFAVHSLVTVAAVWVLLKPSSMLRLFTLVGATAFFWWWHLPVVVNHTMTLGLLFISIVVCMAYMKAKGQSPFDGGALWRTIAPVLRFEVVCVYLFATVAKLNDGFFDPSLSCAVSMGDQALAKIPFFPNGDWTHPFTIWGTLALELGIPVAFLFRRTRVPALIMGWLFHIMLGFEGFIPFSVMAFFFYTIFLPDDFPERLKRFREARPRVKALTEKLMAFAQKPYAFPLCAAVWLGVGTIGKIHHDLILTAFYQGPRAAFLVYSIVLGWIFIACIRERKVEYAQGAFRFAHPVLILGPLVLILNGLCPYLGLKTQNSYTMYSNLQTEGDQWNHSFMPRAMRVFDYQNDLVRILESSDKKLQACADQNQWWVWFEFQRYCATHPDVAVHYEYKGKRANVARTGDDPVLSKKPPYLLSKVLWFRPVHRPETNTCVH